MKKIIRDRLRTVSHFARKACEEGFLWRERVFERKIFNFSFKNTLPPIDFFSRFDSTFRLIKNKSLANQRLQGLGFLHPHAQNPFSINFRPFFCPLFSLSMVINEQITRCQILAV